MTPAQALYDDMLKIASAISPTMDNHKIKDERMKYTARLATLLFMFQLFKVTFILILLPNNCVDARMSYAFLWYRTLRKTRLEEMASKKLIFFIIFVTRIGFMHHVYILHKMSYW